MKDLAIESVTRLCRWCGKEKLLGKFNKKGKNSNKRTHICNSCRWRKKISKIKSSIELLENFKKRCRERYLRDKEKFPERIREYSKRADQKSRLTLLHYIRHRLRNNCYSILNIPSSRLTKQSIEALFYIRLFKLTHWGIIERNLALQKIKEFENKSYETLLSLYRYKLDIKHSLTI